MTRDRAAAADDVDREVEGRQPVDAGALHELRRERVGQEAGHRLHELGGGRAVRLHADGVDDGVGAAAVGHAADRVGRGRPRGRSGRAPRCRAPATRASRSGHQVDPDHAVAAVLGDAAAHVADRAEAEHDDASRRPGSSAYSTACQAVGSTSERKTKRSSGGPSGTLIGQRVAERHAQVLGLAARHLRRRAWCSRTARRPCPARAPASSRTASAGPGRT